MTAVTLTVEDPLGETDQCNATITVEDNTDPTITCPADITVGNDAGLCGATVNIPDPTFGDNCPDVTFAYSPASGSFFPVGTTQVTATATDAAGNTAECNFNVTVNDTEDPVITCPADITVDNDAGQCGANVGYLVTATDNCPGVGVVVDPVSGSFFCCRNQFCACHSYGCFWQYCSVWIQCNRQ